MFLKLLMVIFTKELNTNMSLKQQFITRPGITLKEYLEEFNMTKLELAKRTSFTIEYISEVINGTKKITREFYLNLKLALGVPAYFWKTYKQTMILN